MQQQPNGRSRKYAVCVRRWGIYPIGTRLQLRLDLFEELKEKQIVTEYTGQWPPITKTKFNLKDLK